MIDTASLQCILNSITGVIVQDVEALRLPGDAGNRAYYRVFWKETLSSKSLILMVLAEPEGFKGSEEAVSGAASPITELPFINIHRHLHASHVAVPKILYYGPERGWLLLEDLGDITLAEAVTETPDKVLPLYRHAIDELIAIQRFATPVIGTPTLAHYRAFDQALFVWEFDHFIEYGIEKREGILLLDKTKKEIRGFFSDIALRLSMLPPVFVHRDYHSRNLMIKEQDKIRVIDFQDALMGPCQYDLASLLRDAYIDLPEEVIDDLILYYLAQWEEQTGEKVAYGFFREMFDLISIQRNLKAAGRFVYIDQVKKKAQFLPYVPKTLAKVKRNLEKHKRLKPLLDLLSKYVKELR